MNDKQIPFNKSFISNNSIKYMNEAYLKGNKCGNSFWSEKVKNHLSNFYEINNVFLVPSCTAALEMGALLIGIKPGDEVIMPSYTFSSTATSIMQFGGKPIFCEINEKTMNIDVNEIESLITEKTKLILPIDYAGVPCEIEKIKEIGKKYSIPIMIDGAQSFGSRTLTNEWSGNNADLVTFSFHETKNISCGEGGALVVNREEWIERANILQEKGTDRKQVLLGLKNKYSWVDYGSSYLLSDILTAILFGQLELDKYIRNKRAIVSKAYKILALSHPKLINTISEKYLNLYNNHGFYFLFNEEVYRDRFIYKLKNEYNISAYIGYIPLHSSKMGRKIGYSKSDLIKTEKLSSCIVRLPIYVELGEQNELLQYVVTSIDYVLKSFYK